MTQKKKKRRANALHCPEFQNLNFQIQIGCSKKWISDEYEEIHCACRGNLCNSDSLTATSPKLLQIVHVLLLLPAVLYHHFLAQSPPPPPKIVYRLTYLKQFLPSSQKNHKLPESTGTYFLYIYIQLNFNKKSFFLLQFLTSSLGLAWAWGRAELTQHTQKNGGRKKFKFLVKIGKKCLGDARDWEKNNDKIHETLEIGKN